MRGRVRGFPYLMIDLVAFAAIGNVSLERIAKNPIEQLFVEVENLVVEVTRHLPLFRAGV